MIKPGVKLKFLFALFFLAMAIPALTLSWKAYEQLRWETFHQYQQDAQLLAKQIDSSLAKSIALEESRSDTDYTFLVLAGDPQARFVQRSDLSKYPVESNFPGAIGYFQVDEKGLFSSPILPQDSIDSTSYGIGPEEKLLRSQLAFNIRSILSRNQLVSNNMNDKPVEAVANELAESFDDGSRGDDLITMETEEEVVTDNQTTKLNEDTLESADVTNGQPAPSVQEKLKMKDRALAKREKQVTSQSKNSKLDIQGGFSQLQSDAEQQRISRGLLLKQKSSANVERKKINPRSPAKISSPKTQTQNLERRNTRKETNYLPQQSIVGSSTSQLENDSSNIEINLFESELEPFRYSLLSSGHSIAYRQVWRNNRRIIQGAVISTEEFVLRAIETQFLNSYLPSVSILDVLYGDNVLARISQQEQSYSLPSQQLVGKQLLAVSLNDPFNQLSLSFKVTQIPAGAGASFIIMVALSLMVILTLGTYLLYRLTLKQSLLVRQQQDFVSSVSHELKTPLTSIRMYGEILKQGWMSDDKREEYYDYIYNEAERLSRLIANVLQISKVNRSALELELKPVSIAEIVSVIQSKIDSQIRQSHFSFESNVDESLTEVLLNVDIDALIQIVINLVDNAIKYAANAELQVIEFNVTENKNKGINISIRDFGPGVSKSQINKIFELFYRTGDEMTRECAGTGIGLALVKELANAMKAEVTVVNRSVGAEFVLRFSIFSR